MVAVIALTCHRLSLLDPVLNMWCVIFKQYFMKFWDKGFTLETKHWWWLYISEKMKFPMDLHIKAYHLNHWLLSLYGFKYLHYSVTLSSRGWNPFPGVCSDLDICSGIYLPGSYDHLTPCFATVFVDQPFALPGSAKNVEIWSYGGKSAYHWQLGVISRKVRADN